MAFAPIRELLNPKFDGYKLQSITESDSVSQFLLPEPGISQSTVSGRTQISFQEVKSRVRQNHLAVGINPGTFAYIDKENQLVLVEVNQTSLAPKYTRLAEIPVDIQTEAAAPAREYPVAVAVDPTVWLVSDGAGRLYLINSSLPSGNNIVGTYEAPSGNNLLPTHLHSAILRDGSIVCLLSRRSPSSAEARSSRPTLNFDLLSIRLPIPASPIDEVIPAETLWTRTGTDLPAIVNHISGSWLVAATSIFNEPAAPIPIQIDPTPDELVTIPRAEEPEETPLVNLPPPYSWTQTSDSVTVSYPLPSCTLTSSIRVNITHRYVTILVAQADTSSSFPIPRFTSKELWGEVDRTASLWTWDKDGDRMSDGDEGEETGTVGLLTLHLEKRHEGTKWPHVYANTGTGKPDAEEEVSETVDPSELWKVREAMEKYTRALQTGEDASGLGLGTGVPSLAEGEIDMEVDAEAGKMVTMVWYDCLTGKQATGNTNYQEVLSNPIPTSDWGMRPTFVIKYGLDGLRFAPPANPTTDMWEHISTYPALAFVLASKRDTRFAYHFDEKAVFAIESGGRDGAPNVFIYQDAKGAKTAKQSVLRAGDSGDAGSVLGVAGMVTDTGEPVMVCLRERALVMIRRFL